MKFFKDRISKDSPIPIVYLWWLPALAPLFLILSAFTTGTWSWGLMDDHRFAFMTGSVWERFIELYDSLLSAGRFYPTFVLHTSLLYKVFANNPLTFYIFRFVEVVVALSVWSALAYKVTGRKAAMALMVAISLSFLRFYDAFFYLSTQEILGVLFVGLAGLFFLKTLEKENIKWYSMLVGFLFILLAVTSKEPFISASAALGLSFIIAWIGNRKSIGMLVIGLFLFLFAMGYAFGLKMFVMKAYSASYSFDWEKIQSTVIDWYHTAFKYHIFWLVLSVPVFFLGREKIKFSQKRIWGVFFGIFLYGGYLLFILPWSGGGHYITPLGIFFAFFWTVLLIDKVESIPASVTCLFIVLSLALNISVGAKATNFHAGYQRDTATLLEWISLNKIFEIEVMAGREVRCNANEPCGALSTLANQKYGKSYKPFIFSPHAGITTRSPKTRYYIWAPSWGNQDLRQLEKIWVAVFVSENWYVFRRFIDPPPR